MTLRSKSEPSAETPETAPTEHPVETGYSRSISAGGSWRPYLLVFRVWLIRSLTPPKTELPATIANRRPKVEKYRGNFGAKRGASVNKILISWYKDLLLFDVSYCVRVYH
jgi:hypothetical protein